LLVREWWRGIRANGERLAQRAIYAGVQVQFVLAVGTRCQMRACFGGLFGAHHACEQIVRDERQQWRQGGADGVSGS
jgi:hypothetical protein